MCICYSVSSIHLTTNFYLRDGLFGNLVPRGQTLGNNVLTIEFDKDLIDLYYKASQHVCRHFVVPAVSPHSSTGHI